MKLQRISNIRLQNFGHVVVLEPGNNLRWTELDSMTAGSSYGRQWVATDKARLIVFNGAEQVEIAKLREASQLVAPQHQVKVRDRIWARIVEFGQNIKPKIINSVDDLRNIRGFEKLAVASSEDGLRELHALLNNL